MEKFEVYNRKTNTWKDDNVELVSGWNENFVLDKTTDTASVKIKYKGLQKPDWDIGDWCRLIHLENGDTKATHIEEEIEGKRDLDPLNFFEVYDEVNEKNQRVIVVSMLSGNYVPEEIVAEFYIDYTSTDYEGHFTDTRIFTFNEKNDFKAYYTISGDSNKISIDVARIQNFNPSRLRSYENIYLPLNNEQYVIKNITMLEDKINEEIDIQLDLEEPINITSGILCETMSFTNQIEKKVDNVIYTHEPLNHLSVLEKILKVTPANTDTYEDGYDAKKNKSWFNRIKIVDKQLLKLLAFNDETYNEASLYEILLNKYDSSVGRTPVIYFDLDSKGNPNNIERPEYILKFERQDGYDKEEIEFSSLVENAKEIVINKSGENYTDGIVSNYDNLSPNTSILSPSETLWIIPEIDSNQRDITEYNENNSIGKWVLKTPHAIKNITKVERFYIRGDYSMQHDIATVNKDLLVYNPDQILEEKQYIASDKFNTRNCVWYKEGGNLIYVNEAYYEYIHQGVNYTSKIWVYKVTYEPFISGRFDLGKDYQTQINQVDVQIDSYKFGKYIEEYFKSMNKADITIQKTVNSVKEIAELGQRVLKDNSNFIITNISIQNRGFDYDVIYQLNENHIRRSDTIEASKEIRKNIEISVDATKERKSMLPFTAGISYKIQNKEFYETELSADNKSNILEQMFSQLLEQKDINYDKIQLAHITFNSELMKENKTKEEISISRLCEIGRFYINNTICFNMKYFDNAEAGKKKDLHNYPVNLLGTTFYAMPESQIPILYTNPFGEFDTFNLDFIKIGARDISTIIPDEDISDATDIPQPEEQQKALIKYLKEVNAELTTMATYPLPTSAPEEDINNPISTINNIQYYKDMLDTFNYTIAFNYKFTPDIILCKGFFKNSPLMYGNGSQEIIYKTFNTNITEEDIQIEKHRSSGYISSSHESEEIVDGLSIKKILYYTQNNLDNAKSIALLDANTKDAIIIINNFNESGKSFSIYHS